MTTTNIDGKMGSFHVKIRYQIVDHVFFYKQLLIEDSKTFEKMLRNANSKKIL